MLVAVTGGLTRPRPDPSLWCPRSAAAGESPPPRGLNIVLNSLPRASFPAPLLTQPFASITACGCSISLALAACPRLPTDPHTRPQCRVRAGRLVLARRSPLSPSCSSPDLWPLSSSNHNNNNHNSNHKSHYLLHASNIMSPAEPLDPPSI